MVNALFQPSKTDLTNAELSNLSQYAYSGLSASSGSLTSEPLPTSASYSGASSLSTNPATTAATDSAITAVNADGTYTVAGWTWNPNNAVIDGSIISGEAAISTFASGFLSSEAEPLAKQTVGSLLLNQSNGSVTLGNSSSRAEIELSWGGLGLTNGLGNDFVVYENGNINKPEGYAVAVRLAGSDTFTPFRYEFYDTFEGQVIGNPTAGVLATAFDLSDFGLANGQAIDAVRIINLQPDDLVNGNGQGFLGTSGVSPLDPTTGQPFALDKLDPDITFVAGLRDLQPVEPAVYKIVGTGDFNGDGQTDILFRNRGTGNNLVWLMNGTQLVTTVALPSWTDPNWDIKQTGDFNGDGQTDIVWRNEVTGENTIWLMNGTQLVNAVSITGVPDLNWDIRGTGDFNGDGTTDILWRNRATGDDIIWQMDGTNLDRGVYTNPVENSNWYIGGTGDFNGDGRVDIVWRKQDTGENALLLMGGIYPNQETLFIDSWDDPNWEIRSTGDLNGDGQVDILWQNTVTNDLVVWLMDGTQLSDISSIG